MWPYGIKVLKKVDTASQWKRLQEANSLREDPIRLSYEWGHGDTAELHVVVDDRLKGQNCFQLTAHPPFNLAKKLGKFVKPPRFDFRSFTLLVAVDFTHIDFLRTFNHRRHTFPNIAATAFYCFLKALEYTSEQKHLAEIAARTDPYAEFLKITQPVPDEMPAIRREEKDARQKQQQQERKVRKRKQEQGTSTIRSLIAKNQISLPCAEPQNCIIAPEDRPESPPASNGPTQCRLGMHAGPSASSSADTFMTAAEDAPEGRNEASTLTGKPAAAAGHPTDDNICMEDVEPSTHDVSSLEIPQAHQSRPSSPSQSTHTSDSRCVSSSPTLFDYDELSQASNRSRQASGPSSPINKSSGYKATRPDSVDLRGVVDLDVTAAAQYDTEPILDITRVEIASHDTSKSKVAKCSSTAPARAVADDGGRDAAEQVGVQTGKTESNDLSAIEEEGSLSALADSPSETLVADEAPRPHSTVFSRLPSSSDASEVVSEGTQRAPTLGNGGKKRSKNKRPTLGFTQSTARTSPTKMQKPPSHVLHRGSENLRSTQAVGTIYAVRQSAAYETSSSKDLGGLLKSTLLNDQPVFSYTRPSLMISCWLPRCQRPTNFCDVHTTLCSRCGPYSYVRYCSIKHLHADVRRHYTEECTRRPNHLPYLDESTIYPVNSPPRVFNTCSIPLSDSFERHRQALYHSCPPDARSDYYIFSDVDNLIANEGSDVFITPPLLATYRGTGSVVATVRISSKDVRKAQFAGVLERLLSMGCAAGAMDETTCGVLFLFIKGDLRDKGMWDEAMINRLCLAMQLEFGWRVPPRYV